MNTTIKTEFRPRPAQERILAYRGGQMGISAVPGAGKTHILAVLAAQLVASSIDDHQEVLIVTLVNSAVENIKNRIAEFVGTTGLLKNVGYRVRTLHGLAHDIVRERPGLVDLAEDFQIVDERETQHICEITVDMWLRSHPDAAEPFLSSDLGESRQQWVLREQWPEAVNSLASAFIKRAKDLRLSAEDLLDRLARLPEQARGNALPLARMGAEIYADYQAALHNRGAVDFDDLIRLAWHALNRDPELLLRLRHQWPFILEDEAQDSSAVQEAILGLLSGPHGNWVRVGDPNQAINTTFTTANPQFLQEFTRRPGVTALPLDNSGRSQKCIIDLANHLIAWTMANHPERQVRDALHAPPWIEMTPPGDPQPNPYQDPSAIYLVDRSFSPDAEIKALAQSLLRWLPEHPNDTAAVLVPRNQRGFEVTDALKRAGIEYVELLRSTTSTRKTAGALGNVLNYLATPSSALLLARVFEVWRRADREDREQIVRMKLLSSMIRTCRHTEEYLWPRLGRDWMKQIEWRSTAATMNLAPDDSVSDAPEAPADRDRVTLEAFRVLVCRWQEATMLPIDQLVLTIAQDLFMEPGELALCHKLAILLRTISENNPTWRLPELTAELAAIARNQRRFLGFSEEDEGYEPQPGTVTVSTLHKAKGLEWDRVYVMSVNNYDFPSAQPYDDYISERWFIRDHLNLEAEALAQMQSLCPGHTYEAGLATYQARLDYVAERLRLLYVGITRARKELILTWNTGRSREAKQMAIPFVALHAWWKEQHSTG